MNDFKPKSEEAKSNEERFWDQAFNAWTNNGCIEDPSQNPPIMMPKEHPEKDHLWNKDKQAYLGFMNIHFNLNDPNADVEQEDYWVTQGDSRKSIIQV